MNVMVVRLDPALAVREDIKALKRSRFDFNVPHWPLETDLRIVSTYRHLAHQSP